MSTIFPLEIFYDGDCQVCSSEMGHYRERDLHQRLRFVDIREDSFRARDYGKTQAEFMARLYVRDASGSFFSGVDAFILIWQAWPAGSTYRLLASAAGLPGINLVARGGYALFARYRHLLPKKKTACEGGSCTLDHRH